VSRESDSEDLGASTTATTHLVLRLRFAFLTGESWLRAVTLDDSTLDLQPRIRPLLTGYTWSMKRRLLPWGEGPGLLWGVRGGPSHIETQ
jgi:hypothetical protein